MERLSQKDVENQRLIQRIHGVIAHGLGTFLFVAEPDVVPKGANQGMFAVVLYLNCLMCTNMQL